MLLCVFDSFRLLRVVLEWGKANLKQTEASAPKFVSFRSLEPTSQGYESDALNPKPKTLDVDNKKTSIRAPKPKIALNPKP